MKRVWNTRTVWLAVVFLCCVGQGLLAGDPVPTNGVAYILLPKEIPANMDGVYRLNSYTDPYGPLALGTRMFDLQFSVATSVNGLAVDQDNKVYLFVSPNISGNYTVVNQEGWLPPGMFEPDSPAFIKLIGQPFNSAQVSRDITGPMPNAQYPHGSTNYDGDFWDYGPYPASPHYPGGWPHTHAAYTKGSFTDGSGNAFQYRFNPYAPTSHQGIPLWNGPGGGSAGIHHPTDPYKVILPNKWGGISWYAFGTTVSDYPLKLLDGTGGRPEVTQNDFRLRHDNVGDGYRRMSGGQYVPLMSPYWDAWYISAVVKRIYWKRDRSLDLYSYKDIYVPPAGPPYTNNPTCDAAGVLSATDLDIKEEYGKTCGDGCIPGGPMNPEAIGKVESVVQVFTSTTGRRYGFNPFGKDTGPYGVNDAALRVVHGGTTSNLDLNNTNIRNKDYILTFLGCGSLKEISRMGVSSNFNPVALPVVSAPDYLFGSVAEKFVVQDSWWGLGGVGFEYFGADLTTPSGKLFKKGHIYRLDYLDAQVPNPEDVGLFNGAIDAIGVDGEGNLYVLSTELDCPNEPAWPDPTGMPKGPDLVANWPSTDITGHADYLGQGSWMRPGIGTGDSPVPGPSQAGDYLDLTFRQKIYKTARRYTANAGGGYNIGTVEDRGKIESGFDKISRKLRYDGGTSFSWANAWYHTDSVAGRVASIKGEFAVVNIAARPIVYHGPTECTYSVCRDDPGASGKRTGNDVPIYENGVVTFKLEGYKPFGANGERQHFRGVGNIPGLGITTVNMIPPYENYDEDGNGIAGGFPSSMFESETKKTQIKWCVDLIDSSDPKSTKVLKKFVDEASSNSGGDNQTFTFKFPQPGNYRVYAKIRYNYFDYAALSSVVPGNPRPSDLGLVAVTHPAGAGAFEKTQEVLYQVQSDPNTSNQGYISKIALLSQAHLQGVDAVSGGGTTYDLPENASPTAFSFSFEAQFVRDANRNASDAAFTTYGGVGVWDYGDPVHVYNYVDPTTHNNEFNPGFVKEYDTASQAKHGTEVEGDLKPKDLAAFKWKLFIYPTYDGADPAVFRTDGPGVLYGEGDCSNVPAANITDLGNRKFAVTVNIDQADLPALKTPIDPGTYRVRLELTYPRVKWVEDTGPRGPNATLSQYRSIVLDDTPTGVVTTVPGTDLAVNWDSDPAIFVNGDSWLVRARDFEVGIASISTSPDPIIQSTGDPTTPADVRASLTDNNPNAVFPPDSSDLQIWYQFPKYPRDRSDMREAFESAARQGPPGPMPSAIDFYQNDLQIGATYTTQIAEFDKFNAGQPYQNWVGKIDFAVDAHLQDGYGASWPLDLTQTHHFCASASLSDYPRIIATAKKGLERYDNDPPSLKCSLISQADNRRWEVQLVETVRDAKTDAVEAELSPCKLIVSSFHLNDGSLVGSESMDIPGCSKKYPTNAKVEIDETKLTMTPGFIALLPVVRRSGRLLANFHFSDNVDYLNFTDATFKIDDKLGANLINGTTPPIPKISEYEEGNSTSPQSGYPGDPRARFTADMPMKVDADQGSPSRFQVKVECSATDAEGNSRTLVIPVKIVDSSFETRVLESRENRR